jgi:hypothetical protein
VERNQLHQLYVPSCHHEADLARNEALQVSMVALSTHAGLDIGRGDPSAPVSDDDASYYMIYDHHWTAVLIFVQ